MRQKAEVFQLRSERCTRLSVASLLPRVQAGGVADVSIQGNKAGNYSVKSCTWQWWKAQLSLEHLFYSSYHQRMAPLVWPACGLKHYAICVDASATGITCEKRLHGSHMTTEWSGPWLKRGLCNQYDPSQKPEGHSVGQLHVPAGDQYQCSAWGQFAWITDRTQTLGDDITLIL